ncbi:MULTISPECIES: stage VI sporulation protein F [Paenibacillus]|uniref:Serine/threonine protein kinase n=1 Tax=Paenibacillus campinasensis TaxID=66347 RepID=A0A268F3L0_9BACL|nr:MULTISPECIES: stage VI sporulation protein F [Paenibacillus]MUG64807.1 serine/threonine protein kinase [Paenibacillus campinasensis]PAD79940.1 serine/threonine protein kinase [Paenibacillus campinasensis]PAK55514.1 serine/threonine protein kinase [Paenibacillus sp. 7541]
MSYQQYGISPQLVERIKLKMKNPAVKERIKGLTQHLTKSDLQNSLKVQQLVRTASGILNERLTATQEQQIVQFVLAQRIDPKNTFHLIKLWGMFR